MKSGMRTLRDKTHELSLRAGRFRFRFASRSPVTVFMYHRVTSDATKNWGPWRYALTPEAFESHVSHIAESYNVLPIDELIATATKGADLPDRPAVITFDDGYRDTLTEAIPILDCYDLPATVYVSTDLLGSTEGPFEFQLANAVESATLSEVEIPDLDAGLPDGVAGDPWTAYRSLRDPVKTADPDVEEQLLKAVSKESSSVVSTPMLTEEQVEVLGELQSITVGAHGHEHSPLTSLDVAELRSNVQTSADRLESILSERPRHFSYPYGANDEVVRTAVEDAGFCSAVTTEPRFSSADEVASEPFRIPRVDGARYRV